MKQLIVLLILTLIICLKGRSQSAENTDYLQKSRNQKTAAWALLGGGVGLTVVV